MAAKHVSAQQENPARLTSRLKILITGRPDNRLKMIIEGHSQQNNKTQHENSSSQGKRSQVSIIRLRGEDEVDAISNDVSMVTKSDISDLGHQGLPSDIL